jgi:hypothetical protein
MTASRGFLAGLSCCTVSCSFSWVGVVMADGTPSPQWPEEDGSFLVFVTSASKIIHQLVVPADP